MRYLMFILGALAVPLKSAALVVVVGGAWKWLLGASADWAAFVVGAGALGAAVVVDDRRRTLRDAGVR